MFEMKHSVIFFAAYAALFAGLSANGDPYAVSSSSTLTHRFVNITGNNAVNVATAEQYSCEIKPVGESQMLLTLRNSGPVASSITAVHLSGGALLDLESKNESPGVSFSMPATPGDFPGGASLKPISADAGQSISAGSGASGQANGVGPGESIGLLFNLLAGLSFADTENGLRVGIHVEGFADGGSESFVNVAPIPAPAAATLGSLGLGLLAWPRKRPY